MSAPSLPALAFNSISVTLAGTSYPNILDGIYTALTTTTADDGQSIPTAARWQVTRYQNAGTTEAVYCEPAATSPVAGKIVLIWAAAASGPHSNVVMKSPDTYANSVIIFSALVATAAGTISRSNYSAWDGATPFTAGGRFMGYNRVYAGTTASKIFLFPSTDSILLQIEEGAGAIYPCRAGLDIRGLTDGATDGESGLGGRVASLMVGGSDAAMNAAFWTAAPSGGSANITMHSGNVGQCHCWYLVPNSSTVSSMSWRSTSSNAGEYQIDSALSQVGLSGAIEPDYIVYRDLTSGRKIGRDRAMFWGPRRKTKAILSATSTKTWIVFGSSSTSDVDCALLPM